MRKSIYFYQEQNAVNSFLFWWQKQLSWYVLLLETLHDIFNLILLVFLSHEINTSFINLFNHHQSVTWKCLLTDKLLKLSPSNQFKVKAWLVP